MVTDIVSVEYFILAFHYQFPQFHIKMDLANIVKGELCELQNCENEIFQFKEKIMKPFFSLSDENDLGTKPRSIAITLLEAAKHGYSKYQLEESLLKVDCDLQSRFVHLWVISYCKAMNISKDFKMIENNLNYYFLHRTMFYSHFYVKRCHNGVLQQ